MKKDLFKVLGITLLLYVILSFIIPAGAYSSGSYTALGETSPIGLYSILSSPIVAIASFIQFGILFLAIGGLYGILPKTGVYSKIVNDIVNKYEKKKTTFLIITIINFALLSSIIGVPNLIIALMPFFATILLKLGFSKMTTLTSTIGSILVGQTASIIGSDTWGFTRYFFSLKNTDLLLARIILFVIITFLFIFFVKKTANKEKNTEILLYEDNVKKKSALPLIITLSLGFLIMVIGSYSIGYVFEASIFDSLHESISSFEIKGYPLLANVLGSTTALGYWGDIDLAIVITLISFVISWIYSVKMEEFKDGYIKGVKQMILPALYATLSYMIFGVIYNMQSGNFINTIISKLMLTDFSFIGTTVSALIASFTYTYYPILLNSYSSVFGIYDTNILPTIALMVQALRGLVLIVAPTSMLLLSGLAYFDISYKDWIKHIFKYALTLFGIIIVVMFILTTLL